MRRRQFLSLLSVAAAWPGLWPVRSRAQQSAKVFRIGFLGSTAAEVYTKRVEAFRAGLQELGYQEDRNVLIEFRWADGRYERLPSLVAELVRSNPDVIVTHGTPATLAAQRATTQIPIVMATSGDAEASGLVASLARPGGNVTGLTFFNPELVAKRCELLRESLPRLKAVGLLLNPANPMNEPIIPKIRLAAQALGLQVELFGVHDPAEFEGALAAMVAKQVGAVVILDDAILIDNSPTLARLALQHRLASSAWPTYAVSGGAIGYGVDFPDKFRRAAAQGDKILKGSKPTELPVERATKFEMVVNVRTLKALGLDAPASLLARADTVIE